MSVTVELPEVALVVVLGGSSAAREAVLSRFDEAERLDPDAREALQARLEANLPVVVDATRLSTHERGQLSKLGKDANVLRRAVAIAAPDEHGNRPPGPAKLRDLGFRDAVVLEEDDALEVTVVRARLANDRRDERGPFDLIGDVHGCAEELEELLDALGYEARDGIRQRDDRRVIFLGDLVDRGPGVVDVLRIAMPMVAAGAALCIRGNHEAKLLRWLRGKSIKLTHGTQVSVDQLEREPDAFRLQVKAFLASLPYHLRLHDGELVVAHAGLKEALQGRASGKAKSFALYGDTTGESDAYGFPVRLDWAQHYRGEATVVYGHTPVLEARWVHDTICLDTGCVFGGKLTALRWPERELVSVPARAVHYAPTRPLA